MHDIAVCDSLAME